MLCCTVSTVLVCNNIRQRKENLCKEIFTCSIHTVIIRLEDFLHFPLRNYTFQILYYLYIPEGTLSELKTYNCSNYIGHFHKSTQKLTLLSSTKQICIYYSNFDKQKCTYFNWAQCNEPTTLTLGNLRCFSLISTKFAVVIATAFSYRLKCKSYTGWPRAFLLIGKRKIWVF